MGSSGRGRLRRGSFPEDGLSEQTPELPRARTRVAESAFGVGGVQAEARRAVRASAGTRGARQREVLAGRLDRPTPFAQSLAVLSFSCSLRTGSLLFLSTLSFVNLATSVAHLRACRQAGQVLLLLSAQSPILRPLQWDTMAHVSISWIQVQTRN